MEDLLLTKIILSVLAVAFLVAQFITGYRNAAALRDANIAYEKSQKWMATNYPEEYYGRRQASDDSNPWDVSRMEQVYQGNGVSSSPVLSKSDHQIFHCSQRSGSPAFSIHGDKVYRGSQVSGNPVATISGDAVYLGHAYSGTPLATISGKVVYKGKAYSGTPLATASSERDKELLAAAALKLLGH